MEHNEKRAVVIILRKLGNIDKMFCPAVAMQQNIKFGAGFLLYPSTGNVDGTCTVSETVTNYMAQCMAKLVPIWKIDIYITGPYRNIECMEYG